MSVRSEKSRYGLNVLNSRPILCSSSGKQSGMYCSNRQDQSGSFERTRTHKRFTYGCTSKFTIFIHSFFLFLHTMQSFEQYLWSSLDTLTITTKRTCTCLCIHLFENHVYIFWFHRPYVILSSGYLFDWSYAATVYVFHFSA